MQEINNPASEWGNGTLKRKFRSTYRSRFEMKKSGYGIKMNLWAMKRELEKRNIDPAEVVEDL